MAEQQKFARGDLWAVAEVSSELSMDLTRISYILFLTLDLMQWIMAEQQKFAWGDLWTCGRGLPRARSGTGDLAFLHIQPDMQHQECTSVFHLICNTSVFYLICKTSVFYLICNRGVPVLDAQYLILVACLMPQDQIG